MVVGDERPEESVPGLTPVALGKITHFPDVVGPGEVGLGGEDATIGKLAHSIDIRHHDPVVSVDKQLHEPPVNIVGINPAEEHEIAQDHESLNVVAIGMIERAVDADINGWNTSRPFIKSLGHFPGEFPEIPGTHFGAVKLIHGPHEFAPADDLTDESLQRIKGNVIFFRIINRVVNDRPRGQKTGIEHGGEDGVVEGGVAGGNGVLVISE